MPSFMDIFLPWRPKIQEPEPAKETTYPCVSVPQMTATVLQPVKSARAAVVNPALAAHSYPQRYYPSRPPSRHVTQRPNRQVPLVVPPSRIESKQVVGGPMQFQAKDIPTLRPLWPERAQVDNLRTELSQLERKVIATADRQEVADVWREEISTSLKRLQCSLDDVTRTVSAHTRRVVELEKMLDMLPAFRGGTPEEKYEMVDIAVQQLTNKVECLLSNMFAEKETNHKLLEILKKQYEESVGQEAKIGALTEQLERYQTQALPRLEVVERAPVSDMRVFVVGSTDTDRCTRSFSRVAHNILLFGVLSVEGGGAAEASLELAQHIQCGKVSTHDGLLTLPFSGMDKLGADVRVSVAWGTRSGSTVVLASLGQCRGRVVSFSDVEGLAIMRDDGRVESSAPYQAGVVPPSPDFQVHRFTSPGGMAVLGNAAFWEVHDDSAFEVFMRRCNNTDAVFNFKCEDAEGREMMAVVVRMQ